MGLARRNTLTMGSSPPRFTDDVKSETEAKEEAFELQETREQQQDQGQPQAPPDLVESLLLPVWCVSVGAFLMYNYYWASSPWPAFLTAIDVRTWALVHAVSGTLFAGGIFTTAFVEWLVFRSHSTAVQAFWFQTASKAEVAIVLPGLTGSLVSGVAQAWLMYQRPVQFAPLHVRLPIHILVAFGLWWLVTDVATRSAAEDKAKQGWRQGSNLVSCLFLVAIYGIMVLKPGG
mmetsp:Transcript_30316/g.85676  ORF Transcript_30316/g.85676 Transcript_30316/m.85676 type:complete len:232 (-) Transcript_30316:50-745(-)